MSNAFAEDVPRLILEMGYLCMKTGSLPQAQAYLEAAQALRPNDPTPPMFMGMWHFAQGHFGDAEKSYRRVLDTHASHDLTRAFLAESLIAQKRWPEAEKILASVVQANKDAAAVTFAQELINGLKLGVFHRTN